MIDKMTWAGDKKEILSKLVDLYQEVGASQNRWEASAFFFEEFDFFIAKLISNDPTLTNMIEIDREWINEYFYAMSELIGEEP